jgi:uncharacterized protein
MPNPLLDRSSPAELAERGQVVETEVELQTFARLTEVLAADLSSLSASEMPREWRQAPVAIRLGFSWADNNRQVPAAEGRVVARVPAVCQRCLGPMELILDEELKLLLAGPEEAARATGATDDRDVWEIDEASIRPLDILEEALIMALPLAAMHGPGEGCDAAEGAAPAETAETHRPFAGLRSTARGREGGDETET